MDKLYVSFGDSYRPVSALRYYNGTTYKTVYSHFNVFIGQATDFQTLVLDENSTTYNVTPGSYA